MKKPEYKSDSFLVTDFQSGNSEALVILVKRWHKSLCKKAFWIIKDSDAAKDIAQECWDVVIQNITDLKDPSSFGVWISRIVYRKSLDVLRTNKRIYAKKEIYKYEQQFDIDNEEDDNFNEKLLSNAIRNLPSSQQLVIRLFYLEDYSLKEISISLNIPTGTVKSRLFKARETLKLTLKNRTYEK